MCVQYDAAWIDAGPTPDSGALDASPADAADARGIDAVIADAAVADTVAVDAEVADVVVTDAVATDVAVADAVVDAPICDASPPDVIYAGLAPFIVPWPAIWLGDLHPFPRPSFGPTAAGAPQLGSPPAAPVRARTRP